ncbi:TonB-dependent siderophore receptor [Methylobacterium gossipiicola]|uniref:Iron complex outermembrane recepter protein n=1 Tax=Methylobacterium gossipiicola TaxID=582675 RepID=A0A1I2VTI9_9HYPH|nr:TonB-dependent siderophore receptor [Methylobacterium gossipiicola]SFG92470.1 iron complex outermembrane recepter protein [Methylobacterium gossipiicola]
MARVDGNGALRLAAVLGGLAPLAAAAQPAGVPQEVALSELSVAGSGIGVGESATSPVIGYRAGRSATATRTDTALRDTPQSVQVVPREVLEDRQDVRLSDALQNVSNVQPGGTLQGRSDTFVIRGFRTQAYAIDGVLLNQANNFLSTQRDLADVERIEVLKGPASVLYGRGDPGGLVNIVTRRPTLTPSGDLTVQGGSFGFARLQGSVSGALPGTEGFAGRVSFAAQDDPTFRNYGDGRSNSRFFVAPAFTWTPTADTRVEFLAEITRQDSQYDEGLIARRGRVPLDDIARFYGTTNSRYSGASNFATLRIEHDLTPDVTLRQIVNVQSGGFDVFAARATAVNPAGTLVTRRGSSVESNFASLDTQSEIVAKFDTFGLRNTFLAGFEYTNGYRNPYSLQTVATTTTSFLNPVPRINFGAFTLQSDIRQRNDLYGVYLQDQIDLGAGLQILLGTRMDFGTQFYFNRTPTSRTVPPEQELFGFSPRVGLVYRPIEPLTFYASYTNSFKPQTDNVLGVNNPPPETGVQYEVGARYDLVPDRLTLSAAAFSITRQNVSANDPVNTGFSVITGEQRSEGIEVDLAGEILPGWKIIGGLGYLDARITRDTTFAVGNRLVGVPAFSGSVWSTYQIPDGEWRGLGVGFGATYVGARFGDLNNSYKVGAYTRLDAAVFYDYERYRFALNLRNLTDARYIEQPFNTFNNQPGAPFTVLATITARM